MSPIPYRSAKVLNRHASQPRTHLVPEGQPTVRRPSGMISWIPHVIRLPDRIILQHSGLDAFFFIRYIRTLLTIFISLSIVIIPCLLPLNLLGGNDAGGTHGLDRYSWANIGPEHTAFFWAHLATALLVIAFVCYTIYVELVFYVHVRNSYLKSPAHRLSEAANTILVTDVPEKDLPVLEDVYDIFPGGVHSVWINRDLSALSKKIREQKNLVNTLEGAETNLIMSATKSFRQRKSNELTRSGGTGTQKEGTLWRRYLKEKARDQMYIPRRGCDWMPAIPFVGKRVDTIQHCFGELARTDKDIRAELTELTELELDGRESSKYPRMRSAFIRFNTQTAAYMACQVLLNANPLHFSARHVNVSGRGLKWDTLNQRWWNRYVRRGLVWISIASLLIAWAIPVAFTGVLSQITTLGDSVSWLHWISNAPAWLAGILQGVLPQVMLVALNALLPLVLRTLTGWQGLSTETAIELSLQKSYFVFLFAQNFLTVSLSSSITAIAQELLHGPNSTPALLAKNIPKASNYFFSYLALQGLTVSASALLQAGSLISWFILAPRADRTPRQKLKRLRNLPEIRWGTFYPLYTTLACIGKSLATSLRSNADGPGLTYSIIAPLIILFSVAMFGLFWLVFRYNLLYVSASPCDTGGQLYPTALKQLFTGVYVLELCLIGLFLSIRNDQDAFTGISQAVVMIIATVLTVVYQLILQNTFSSSLSYLPVSTGFRDGNGEEKNGNRYSTPGLDGIRSLVHRCYGWMKPSEEVPRDLRESIEEFAQNQVNAENRRGYKHEAVDYHSPVVWIPRDDLGVSEDEIVSARDRARDIRVSNEFAHLDIRGRLEISPNVFSTDIIHQ